ncbi:TIGR02301 family protein [Caulobacter sp. UNC279MFTsu5.1]|uniref:TIGR02301 family protein n=1 Tax=Caulobacter sp. UNC279MFTsu5.1 TaxID=1502775 RepID=UPI0008E114AF|nr:TIGR02301 family protein [Caulobacter sp. UNC279MFTsu5.1]SFI68409.1 TIGR02301 family protein [Caulobacter sp. UNC279MFTsu5.1]
MKRLPLNALLALLALLGTGPALAQDRGPVERQTLLDLAFTLGESHALRQVCEGAGDQYWRARMMRLTDVEKADQAFDAQLRDRFNTGFAARQGEFPQCDEASRRAEQQTAVKGRALAARLARSMRTRAPSDQASPETVADN